VCANKNLVKHLLHGNSNRVMTLSLSGNSDSVHSYAAGGTIVQPTDSFPVPVPRGAAVTGCQLDRTD
jgi:hypothetical protein